MTLKVHEIYDDSLPLRQLLPEFTNQCCEAVAIDATTRIRLVYETIRYCTRACTQRRSAPCFPVRSSRSTCCDAIKPRLKASLAAILIQALQCEHENFLHDVVRIVATHRIRQHPAMHARLHTPDELRKCALVAIATLL